MSIFSFFRPTRPKSAETAKERLQILLAHERVHHASPDYLPLMQKEILAVIAKYIAIDEDKVAVKLDRNGDFSTLEVNIELPQPATASAWGEPRLTPAPLRGAAR